jgi:hypothetical protein
MSLLAIMSKISMLAFILGCPKIAFMTVMSIESMMTSWIDIRAAEDGIMTATSVVAYVMSML